MARNAASFSRPKPCYKPQPTVLVICEDSKSGKRYLEDACLHFRVKVVVEITHCGKTDPLNIVREAIRRQGKFDKVFCAIDRDTHETFTEALNLANSSQKVEIIASYPCFEFWLLLHFGYSRKPYAAAGKHSAGDMLIKDLRTHSGLENYDKGLDQGVFALLLQENRFAKARVIAAKVLTDAKSSGEMNPSTRVHELMDFFEKLSLPQKVTSIP